jgi:hypothetical protein
VETMAVNKDTGACGQEKRIERVSVGGGGGLRDAVVWAPGTAGTTSRPPAARAELDQRGCEFRPPVLPMRGGEVGVLNSDPVLHNIHTFSEKNPPVNKAQPKFKKVITLELAEPEMIQVRCVPMGVSRSECPFCTLDTPAVIVYRDTTVQAFVSLAPINRYHVIIAPRAHFEHLAELPPATVSAAAW